MSNSLQPMVYIVHGILQARILEWVAPLLSRACQEVHSKPETFSILKLHCSDSPWKQRNPAFSSLLQVFVKDKTSWCLRVKAGTLLEP